MRFIISALLLVGTQGFSQNHDYNWVFGYSNFPAHPLFGGFNLTFNKEPPEFYADPRKIDIGYYCGACSDSSGKKLLFYTNGRSIQNSTDNTMENGDTINPGPVWASNKNEYPFEIGAVALPAPGEQDVYYLIHLAIKLDANLIPTREPLYYTKIDMKVNNGLGKVLEKNVPLLSGMHVIPYACVKHGNGRDWWILSAKYSEPTFYLFLLSPEGITGPYVQEIGPPFPGPEGGGNCLFSPDGRTYIRHDARYGLRIFDFDRCTGLLSNLRILPFIDPFYSFGAAISADSRFLYIHQLEVMMQLDLQAEDIGLTLDTLQVYDNFCAPNSLLCAQFFLASLGPDGKIYHSTANGTRFLHTINAPLLPGHACDFAQHGTELPKFNGSTVCRFPNYRLGTWDTAPCDTLEFQGQEVSFRSVPFKPVTPNYSDFRIMTPLGRTDGAARTPAREGEPDPRSIDFFFKTLLQRRQVSMPIEHIDDEY